MDAHEYIFDEVLFLSNLYFQTWLSKTFGILAFCIKVLKNLRDSDVKRRLEFLYSAVCLSLMYQSPQPQNKGKR
jgi:hypothetical protein